MKFNEMYSRTQEVIGETTFSQYALEEKWKLIKPGVYNHGLLTICGAEFDLKTLESWSWLTGKDALIIAYLAWGDFIYISFEKKAIFLVIAQEGDQIFLGDNLESVFDYNLASNKFYTKVMLPDKFDQLKNSLGELKYNECYAPTPWLMLGGTDTLENYKRLTFSIYIDIIGQSWSQAK